MRYACEMTNLPMTKKLLPCSQSQVGMAFTDGLVHIWRQCSSTYRVDIGQ